MEYEKVFAAVVVAAVGILAIMTMIGDYNQNYGTDIGNSFNDTIESVQTINNITHFTGDLADTTENIEGAGTGDSQTTLVQKSLRVLTLLPRLLGLVPDLFYQAAIIMGIPPAYAGLAVGVFTFAFILLLAYLLLIGARRLV